ncbi:MAG: glycosyltransferase, partial [Rhodobacteraceae bacterium]
ALPYVIVEAFQAGTPAVATACSGVVELIDDSVGRLAPIGDVEAICSAVAELLSDTARLEQMGRAALARSREDRFDPNYICSQFEATYRAITALRR